MQLHNGDRLVLEVSKVHPSLAMDKQSVQSDETAVDAAHKRQLSDQPWYNLAELEFCKGGVGVPFESG